MIYYIRHLNVSLLITKCHRNNQSGPHYVVSDLGMHLLLKLHLLNHL